MLFDSSPDSMSMARVVTWNLKVARAAHRYTAQPAPRTNNTPAPISAESQGTSAAPCSTGASARLATMKIAAVSADQNWAFHDGLPAKMVVAGAGTWGPALG